MKAVRINISLNPELAEFARSDSQTNAFDSMSEYVRDLIRHRRRERMSQDRELLVRSTTEEKGVERVSGQLRRF